MIPGSILAHKLHDHGTQAYGDHFTNAFHNADWRVTLEQAQKVGIGEQTYELVTIK